MVVAWESLTNHGLLIPVRNSWARDRQPEDSQHRRERRKSESEPPAEKTVVLGRQLGVRLDRTNGKITHPICIHTTGSQKAPVTT